MTNMLDDAGSPEAANHFRWAVHADGSPLAWADLGHVLLRSGQASEAERALTQALHVDPTCSTALENLLLLHPSRGR